MILSVIASATRLLSHLILSEIEYRAPVAKPSAYLIVRLTPSLSPPLPFSSKPLSSLLSHTQLTRASAPHTLTPSLGP